MMREALVKDGQGDPAVDVSAMTHGDDAAAGPPAFDRWAPVTTVETDRYCEGCGYNLRTQSVRRDPRTQLLVCRCPECGRFHAATDAASAGQAWLRRLALLGLLVWGLLLLSAVVGLMFCQGGLIAVTLDELTRYTKMGRVVYYDEEELAIVVFVLGPLSFGIGFLLSVVVTVVFPHWRRSYYTLSALLLPLLPALFIAAVWAPDRPTLIRWGTLVALAYTLVHTLGGIVGVPVGRPLARGVVRMVLPPRLRGPLAYLWLTDGKIPPVGTPSAPPAPP